MILQTFPIVDKPWTPDEILRWIYKNMHQVSSWVLPNAVKSIALSKTIDDEPVLILFTPRNPLQPVSDYYSLVSNFQRFLKQNLKTIIHPNVLF